jgi:DNA-binding MarR family transcriptional regulator
MQSLSLATKKSSAMDCARELLDAAPPMMWHIRRAMRQHRGGLSMPQFRAMVYISNKPCISLSGVAEHLAFSLPTTSRIITGLVNKGFLKRQGCAEDRRQMSLGITSRGQAVLSGAWGAAQQSVAVELKQFTPQQRAELANGMRMVKQMFGSLGLGIAKDE